MPHVDDGVRLDVLHGGVGEAQLGAVPLGRADDAGGHRVLQGEGTADRHHKLPRPEVRGPAQLQDGQRVLGGTTTQGRGSGLWAPAQRIWVQGRGVCCLTCSHSLAEYANLYLNPPPLLLDKSIC